MFNYLQKLLEAIVKAVSFAKERYLNAPRDWQEVIDAVNSLLPKREIENFKEFCAWAEYGLNEYDANHVNDFEMILNGNDEKEEEVYDSDNMPTDRFKETEKESDVHDGFLAKEMWKGYKEWLSNRPEELECFEKFMVRSCLFIVFVRHTTNC